MYAELITCLILGGLVIYLLGIFVDLCFAIKEAKEIKALKAVKTTSPYAGRVKSMKSIDDVLKVELIREVSGMEAAQQMNMQLMNQQTRDMQVQMEQQTHDMQMQMDQQVRDMQDQMFRDSQPMSLGGADLAQDMVNPSSSFGGFGGCDFGGFFSSILLIFDVGIFKGGGVGIFNGGGVGILFSKLLLFCC